ncbi:MAG: ABC transporter substrate-binding protein, partial [Steroidobacteraceae bacterium]
MTSEACNRLLTAMLCALALIAGCSSGAQPGSHAQLRVAGSGSDLGQPDPHVSTKSQDKFLFGLLYNGLVRFHPGRADAAAIEPDLAERWSVSADRLVWTFQLRRDVRFHELGRTLTAADVVYSLHRVANPQLSSVAADYAVITDASALDDHTVQITLARPTPYLLGLVSNYQGGMVVAAPSAAGPAKNAIGAPYGTGPYYVADYQPRRYLLLRGNPEYFRGRPQIDSIIYRFVDSDVSRELASLNGELDLFLGVREGRWVRRVSHRPNMTVDVFGPPELRSLHLDRSKPPLGDVRVRRAIAHAIDREALVSFIGPEVARLARSPLPAGYS